MKRRTIEFMGIKLVVNEYVYEPSDDTELLAKAVIRNIKPFSKALEIGTGSGAIAILLAKLGCDVTATDINPKAIEVAKENATQNNVKIRFIVGDLFAGLNEKFDTIVFNPPYLPEDDFDFL
ncbi:MAG: class I SAM-dependent methyltransferase, partial [Crenarchaeota archaeon]|nr:class I SAM-dependent methyltransferase [Thermoproteota archaeon]